MLASVVKVHVRGAVKSRRLVVLVVGNGTTSVLTMSQHVHGESLVPPHQVMHETQMSVAEWDGVSGIGRNAKTDG